MWTVYIKTSILPSLSVSMKQLCGVTWKPLGIISPGADRNVLSSHPFPVIETQAFSKGFPQMPWLCLGLLSFPKEKAEQGQPGMGRVSSKGLSPFYSGSPGHSQGGRGLWFSSAVKQQITSAANAVSGNSSSNMGHKLWQQAVPSPGWRNQFILEGFVNMRLHLKLLWNHTRTLLQVRSQSIET